MALTPEQEEYYDALEDVFALPGWKLIIEEATKEIYNIQANMLEVSSWERVCELRGEAARLAEFTRLEEVSRLQKAMLEQDDADV
jgi:hypothetical protein